MVMGDAQYWAVHGFAGALERYVVRRRLGWYVAALLPIRFPRPDGRRGQLAPDVMVAFVERRRRQSYDVEKEGIPPAFVVEVVSAASVKRDVEEKAAAYARLGVEEYVLYWPEAEEWQGEKRGRRGLLEPALQGYRRDRATGQYIEWKADPQGRLLSEVLGMWLVARGGELHAQERDGSWLPTHEEEAEAYDEAHLRAEREADLRRRAESEVARLRAELERRQRE